MYLTQIYTPGLAHCSYVVGGTKECLVVDPSRDIHRYLAWADSFGCPITGIIETHLHADFVSGHVELAEATGARVYAPRAARCEFPHVALEDGEETGFDTLLIRLMETPGHTPEGALFIISDLQRGPVPTLAFTGDTVLVGDVGRPDLFPAIKEDLAAKLYHSLRRVEGLRDNLEIYPAHGMGSLCGRSLSAKLSSTLGTERLYNYAFHLHPEERFVRDLLTGMPEAPDHFARCSEINRKGPGLTRDLPSPPGLKPREFASLLEEGYTVLDTRDQLAFAGGHVPGAYFIGLRGNFSTYAGWLLPPGNPLLLVLEEPADLSPALTGLRRVGLDNVAGYLEGGMTAWANSGLETAHVKNISVPELRRRMGSVFVVDTRSRSEWDQGHIEGTVHVPTASVRQQYREWPQEKPITVICNTGSRSMMAASLLKQRGFQKVINVVGGTTAWEAAGYPLVRG